jgi:hypothetical protein
VSSPPRHKNVTSLFFGSSLIDSIRGLPSGTISFQNASTSVSVLRSLMRAPSSVSGGGVTFGGGVMFSSEIEYVAGLAFNRAVTRRRQDPALAAKNLIVLPSARSDENARLRSPAGPKN